MSELYLFTNMNNDRFVGTIILETEKNIDHQSCHRTRIQFEWNACHAARVY